MSESRPAAAGVRWKLPDIEPFGSSPAELAGYLQTVEQSADRLRARYAGRLDAIAPAPSQVADLISQLASIREALERAQQYVYLRTAEDAGDPEAQACREVIRGASGRIRGRLAFFDLEWTRLAEPAAKTLLEAPELAPYARYLTVVRSLQRYALSEREETILRRKSVPSRTCWRDLYNDLCQRIRVTANDEQSPVSLNEAMARLASPDGEMRRTWWRAIAGALEADAAVRATAVRALLADKAAEDAIRGYPGWLTPRSLASDVTVPQIECAIDAALRALPVAQRYFRCRARRMGRSRLASWDLEASFDGMRDIRWEAAREIVQKTFDRLGPRLGSAARDLFDHRIDAEDRPGQNLRGFSHPGTPSTYPYVSVPFTGTDRDVCRLAHEVAHAVHALLSRGQNILCFRAPVMIAEAFASLAEIQAQHVLADELPDRMRRVDLLAACLDGCVSNLFYPAVNHVFEDALHRATARGTPPTVEGIAEEWMRTRQLLYGDAVELAEQDRWWWSRLPHWTAAAGYWQSYCVGHLLALSIWRRQRDATGTLAEDLHSVLSAGGSASLPDLIHRLGFTLDEPAVWNGAIELMERWNDELVSLSEEESHDHT